MKNKILISVIADGENIIQSIKKIISHSSSFSLVGMYLTAENAVKHLPSNPSDILIVDLGLPRMSGENCIKILREKKLNMKIVAYGVFGDENTIISAIKSGADAYILKDTPGDLFIAQLNVVNLGGSTLCPTITEKIIKGCNPQTDIENNSVLLSMRELETLNLISLGLTYSEIASDLEVSIHTVRRHIEKLYKKLNVNSKTQAMLKGKQIGIL